MKNNVLQELSFPPYIGFPAPEGKPRVSLNQTYSTAIFVAVQTPQESKLNGELQGYSVMWQRPGDSHKRESVIGPNITVSLWLCL